MYVITTVSVVKGTLSVAASFVLIVKAPASVLLLARAANDLKAAFTSVEVCMLKLVEAIGPPTATVPATSVSVWAVAATAAMAAVQMMGSVVAAVALVNAQVQVAVPVLKVPTSELSTAVKSFNGTIRDTVPPMRTAVFTVKLTIMIADAGVKARGEPAVKVPTSEGTAGAVVIR